MNLSLTPEFEKLIADQVASGEYATPGEVVWHALTLLEQSEKSRSEQIEEFNRELQARIDSLDEGKFVTAEESQQHFAERSAQRRDELNRVESHS